MHSPVLLNILWLSFDKASRLLIGMVVGIWVARYLGPSQWGELNYSLAIISILVAIANLGMDGFLVKEIVSSPDKRNEILGTAFITRLILIPLGLIAAALYLYLLDSPVNSYYILALLSPSFLIAPLDVIDLDFQSRLQSKLTVVSKNLGYFVGAAIKVYFLYSQKSLLWFAAAVGIETVFSYLFLVFNYQRKQSILRWSFSKSRAGELLRAGWPFMISNIAVILYMRVDQLMIGSLAGKVELGLFSSAVKVTDIFVFIPIAVSGSYLSTLVKVKKEASDLIFIEKIHHFFVWMARLSILIAVSVSFFSSQIVEILYGSQYSGASAILIVHIWALVPMFLGVAAGQYLVIENLQQYNVYKTGIGLLLNVLLNLLLIPKMGALGAATATLVSYYVSAIFSNFLFPATRKLFMHQVRSIKMILAFKWQR
ncbi:flippase [Dyadobacter endophyticus]|nr:flippase [Dyadobacter endophyticus]